MSSYLKVVTGSFIVRIYIKIFMYESWKQSTKSACVMLFIYYDFHGVHGNISMLTLNNSAQMKMKLMTMIERNIKLSFICVVEGENFTLMILIKFTK